MLGFVPTPPMPHPSTIQRDINALKIEATKLKPHKTRNNLSQHQQISLTAKDIQA